MAQKNKENILPMSDIIRAIYVNIIWTLSIVMLVVSYVSEAGTYPIIWFTTN